MVIIRKAELRDVAGIVRVCTEGNRQTYKDLYDTYYLEKVIKDFYSVERITKEVLSPEGWDGWVVAVEDGKVIGAGGGGMIDATSSEIYVLYLDPSRRNEGIGTKLLDYMTDVQQANGAREQWVSVAKDNQKGIPFYEARGFLYQFEKLDHGTKKEDHYVSLRYVRYL